MYVQLVTHTSQFVTHIPVQLVPVQLVPVQLVTHTSSTPYQFNLLHIPVHLSFSSVPP